MSNTDTWSTAQFTETLPALAVHPIMNERTRLYAKQHNMKLAEVMRKALSLFLDAEDAKGEYLIPIVEQPKAKRTRRAKRSQNERISALRS